MNTTDKVYIVYDKNHEVECAFTTNIDALDHVRKTRDLEDEYGRSWDYFTTQEKRNLAELYVKEVMLNPQPNYD